MLVITVSHEVGRLDADIQKDVDAAKKALEDGKQDGEEILSIDDSKKTADGKQQIITATYYNKKLDDLSGYGACTDNLQDNQGTVNGDVYYRHETGNGTQNEPLDAEFWGGIMNDIIKNGTNNGVKVYEYKGDTASGLEDLIRQASTENSDMTNVVIVAKGKLSGNLVLPDLGGKNFGTLLLNPSETNIKIDGVANGNVLAKHIHLMKGSSLTVGDMSNILKNASKRTDTKYVDLFTQEKKEYRKDRYDKYSENRDVEGKKTVDSEPIVINKIVKTQETVKKQYSVDSSVTKVFYANLKAAPGPEPGPGPGPAPAPAPVPPTLAPAPAVAPVAAPVANQGVLGARRAPAPTVDQGVLGKRRAPNTGDSMAIFGWIAGLMATLGGAGAASVALKKTKDKEEE